MPDEPDVPDWSLDPDVPDVPAAPLPLVSELPLLDEGELAPEESDGLLLLAPPGELLMLLPDEPDESLPPLVLCATAIPVPSADMSAAIKSFFI